MGATEESWAGAGASTARSSDLQLHHDVSQVLLRYASAIDHRQWETLATVFSTDAEGRYAGRDPLHGRDPIVAWIKQSCEPMAWQHHLLSVYHIERVGPDEVSALTYHTSHQCTHDDPDTVKVLVGRYYDRLRLADDGGWVISYKDFQVGWRETRRRPS
ncbi:MAG: nuclear transport factor 2 family protein [Acidobacteriota bacterium]|nr:nuclear transport factor 2 family protein [Acidobacteriota bacterium]